MSSTYKMITLVGCSPTSYEDAISRALADAGKSLRHLDWFEVVELRGRLGEGRVTEWQAKIQIGLKVEGE